MFRCQDMQDILFILHPAAAPGGVWARERGSAQNKEGLDEGGRGPREPHTHTLPVVSAPIGSARTVVVLVSGGPCVEAPPKSPREAWLAR